MEKIWPWVVVLRLSAGVHTELYARGFQTEASCEGWKMLYLATQPTHEFITICVPWEMFRARHPTLPLEDS